MTRVPREHMLMEMAWAVSGRSTCSRLGVGAVIARDGRVISSGYNGNIVGMNHCYHVLDEQCTTAVHAEANAILFAARYGTATEGAELYTTHEPCHECAKLIINAGISHVVYMTPYRKHEGLELLFAHPQIAVHRFTPVNGLKEVTLS